MSDEGEVFRILSLDGGGLRGAFAAAVLTVFEEQSERPLYEHFDLIVGTSTGGIIALAIALGIPARDVRQFYQESGPLIFPGGMRRVWRKVAGLWRPRHEQRVLREALERVFSDRRMSDLRTRVVIPAFSATAGSMRLFKTQHHERLTRDGALAIVDVALATSAAPTFLREAEHNGERLVDGGLWAHNPVAVAVTEAIGYLGISAKKVRVLSVGTTTAPYHIRTGAIRRGLAGLMATRPEDLVIAAQTSAARAMAKVLLGGDEHIVRINPMVMPKRFAMDRPSDIWELIGLGEHAATHSLPLVSWDFLLSAPRVGKER